MACSVVSRYSIRDLPASGFARISDYDKWAFKAWNAASYSSVHSNFFSPFSRLKKGIHLYVDLEMNRLRAAILLVRHCTFLCFFRDGMSISAQILAGFVSIPRALTMNPKNFRDATLKEHFWGFSHMLYFLRTAKHSLRTFTWSFWCLDFTSMSST